jgi:hypothetical protein
MENQIWYKAIYHDPGNNPFAHNSDRVLITSTANVGTEVPMEQVEIWARKAGEEKGYRLSKLEVVSE